MISLSTYGTLRWAAALLCVAAVTSCTADPADPWDDLALPLDAYQLTHEDQARVQRARFALIRDCMRRFRIDFRGPSTEPVTYPRNASYIDLLDRDQVEKYGYAAPPGQAEEAAAAQTGIRTGYSVTDEQFFVLEGKVKRYRGTPVPPGGCFAEADGVLNQGAKGVPPAESARKFNDDEMLTFSYDAADLAWKDPRVRAAERSWSACMKEAGFDYATPADAMGDRRWAVTAADDHIEKPRGTRVEIETAVADAGCRLDTGYYGVRRAVYTDHHNRVIAGHRDRLNTIKALNETRLSNAAKVLKGELPAR
ncbi:hypothetical protein [Microtetraspora niveoalba]|uniref:hypothetical protein n=1 Tax=Microtetraspora niveoalba TaxID=46175 RepID=UPI000AAEB67D|nr:hypothetical protein [Microtetraspora niveoalba]